MHRSAFSKGVGAALVLALGACPAKPPEGGECAPGSSRPCSCQGGAQGAQLCADDDLLWGLCQCLVDAGADAAADARSDATEPDSGQDAGMQAARLTWVAIPAGSFEMGCSLGDMECDDDESPRHTVAVAAFELTETEITQQQYLEVTGRISNGHPDCPDCPADEVLWGDARGFCEDVGGRLPSEAEWEYAARAGSTAAWPCSPEPACLAEIAWYEGNSGGESHPVATRAVSSLGLYDMQGNAWEWLEDCLHGEPIDANYIGAPSTGEAWVDGSNANCEMRMLRGGAYFSTEERFRVSYRYYDWVLAVGGRGFRCAR